MDEEKKYTIPIKKSVVPPIWKKLIFEKKKNIFVMLYLLYPMLFTFWRN